ncbi:MAG: glycosyltransferase [Candidatus Thorarchaeota archaeon]|nr:MAG: glycosyltransferase [Candidatus Thorarchaeota archaeon]
MRILQVIPYFTRRRGGSVHAAEKLSIELTRMGHDVTILTTYFEYDSNQIASTENAGVTVTSFPYLVEIGQIIYSPSMKAWLNVNGGNFDIFHMHNFRSYQNNIVHSFANKHQIPYALQPHGSLPPFFEKQRLKRLYDFVCGKRILDKAAVVIALNRMEEEQCISMGVMRNRIRIIPNGINTSEFEHLPERGALRAKLGIDPDWPIVLYLGRIHRIKGLDLLLTAFAVLVKELKDIRLILAGPDDGFLTDLRNRARALEIEDRVIATGPIYGRDKLEAFIDADVYVLPSSYEMFPNTVLEALACRTPVVMTDRCGIADVIRNIGGLVVPYDEDALAGALLSILTQPNLGRKFGQQGRNLVIETYNLSIVAKRVIDVYDSCIQSTD